MANGYPDPAPCCGSTTYASLVGGACNACRGRARSEATTNTGWKSQQVYAICVECEWEAGPWDGAVTRDARRHNRKTGHGVRVTREQVRTYGGPAARDHKDRPT